MSSNSGGCSAAAVAVSNLHKPRWCDSDNVRHHSTITTTITTKAITPWRLLHLNIIWMLALLALKWSSEGVVVRTHTDGLTPKPYTNAATIDIVSPFYYKLCVLQMTTTNYGCMAATQRWFTTRAAAEAPRVLPHINIMSLFLVVLEWSSGAPLVQPNINDLSTLPLPLPPPPPPPIPPRVLTHLNILRIVALLVHGWSPGSAVVKPHIDELSTEIPPVPYISDDCFINSDDIASGFPLLSHVASTLQCSYDNTWLSQRNGIRISAGIWSGHQPFNVNQKSSDSSSSSDKLIQSSTCLALQHRDDNPYRGTMVCKKQPVCKFWRSSWHSHTSMNAEVANILPYDAIKRLNQCKWFMPEPRSPNILF